jgi:hypothetical protein
VPYQNEIKISVSKYTETVPHGEEETGGKYKRRSATGGMQWLYQ